MKNCVLLAGFVAGLLATSAASAADSVSMIAPEAKTIESQGWSFSISPYVWAASLSGDFGQFGLPSIHLSQSFDDILSDLDIATMVIGEARYNRYSLFGDIQYTKVSGGEAIPQEAIAGSVSMDSETFSGLIGAGYSVIYDGQTTLDLVGGARVWHTRTDISFKGGMLDGANGSDSETWADVMAGVRAYHEITENLHFGGWGLIGAGQADIDWDIAAVLDLKISKTFSAVAGYRALGVDYHKNSFTFDAVQQGPILGIIGEF